MNADLERLIALQQLDTAADAARRRLADQPEREKALDRRLEAVRARVAAAKDQLAGNHSARRALEKDVALHQGRLSKFRDQLMAVKTNVEYQAVQKEMAFAQREVKTLEDTILERMLEADEIASAVKRAETDLAAEQKAVDADRRAMAAEVAECKASLDRITSERSDLVASIDKQVLTMFEQIARKRNGVGVAEARDGICTICHVRLRPQVFNSVRRNDAMIQCDSCNRILYFSPPTPASAADSVSQSAQ